MFDQKKLKKRREETVSAVRGERSNFEAMVQRAQRAGETADEAFLRNVRERLAEIEQSANQETNIDELDHLIEDAEQQGQLKAYICPRGEIQDEGNLAIDVMEEWNVPKAVVTKLRVSLGRKLEKADTDVEAARSALRAIYEERDSWNGYTNEYEDEMRRFTRWWLALPTIGLLLVAIITLRFPLIFPLALPILSAGAAGSCVSVMAKMPLLDVSLSGELDSYERRILSRVGVGVIASLRGCGLLGWGLISFSIQGQTFANILDACSGTSTTSCTGLNALIVLAVPMLFGFSERALTSFERKVFRKLRARAGRRIPRC